MLKYQQYGYNYMAVMLFSSEGGGSLRPCAFGGHW